MSTKNPGADAARLACSVVIALLLSFTPAARTSFTVLFDSRLSQPGDGCGFSSDSTGQV